MQILKDGFLPPIPEPAEDCPPSNIAICIDLGTTTVVCAAFGISSRSVLAVCAETNAQRKFGADIMARIDFALKGNAKKIAECAQNQIESLVLKTVFAAGAKIPRPFRASVLRVCITGNTAMLSLLLQKDVSSLAFLPFKAPSFFGEFIEWGAVFKSNAVSARTPVFFPPAVGAFVGADTVCAMIAAEFSLDYAESKLLLDIGTNSEAALLVPKSEKSDGKIICTSCAAGPAFEAANISAGMAGEDGAIDKVFFDGKSILFSTIGGCEAKGICGSGVVSAAAAFLDAKKMSADGEIFGADFVQIAPNVRFLQSDVRALQLAKSAVFTGIEYLLKKTEVPPEFLIAGGFGSKLDFECAEKIAIFPKNLKPKSIGNAALFGAASLIFSQKLREKAILLARKSVCVNLAAIPKFQENFINNCSFLPYRIL